VSPVLMYKNGIILKTKTIQEAQLSGNYEVSSSYNIKWQ